MAGFTKPVYKIVCVKVPEGIFLCETADLHSGRNFIQQQLYVILNLEEETDVIKVWR